MGELAGIGGVVAALSVTSDLTRGHPPGEAMRACLLATELARRAGLDRVRQGEVYYGTLLRFAGCAATSHEIAAAFGGDDIVVRARGDLIDPTVPGEAMGFLGGLGVDAERLRTLGGPAGVARFKAEGARADCEVGAGLAGRLRMPEAVRRAVLDAFERFDGRGVPDGRAGDEVAEAARFAAVGYAAVMFDAVAGGVAAAGAVARWSGRALDPAVAAIFLDAPQELLRISGPDDLQAAVADAEPAPRRMFRDQAALDEALAGFGDAADLKSPWFTGHSGGVARLARAAAQRLAPADATLVYRAGLVHDLGRVAVPAGIWERPGSLRPEEHELIRLHPYHAGRILARSPVLAPLGQLASRHHERTDGSGYPAGVRASELDAAACLLAAAGAPQAALPRLPADLTERELEVLRWLAAGRTKREIAAELVISPSTVHTHTVHIYAKCGVSTRAGLPSVASKQPAKEQGNEPAGNLGLVTEIYDAVGRGDVAAILDRVTDDVDWSAEAGGHAAPWHGPRPGKPGVASFFSDLASSIEILEFVPHSFAAGENDVHLLVRFTFRAIATGRQASMTMHHYWRIRDGKVEHFRGSEDTEQTAGVFAA